MANPEWDNYNTDPQFLALEKVRKERARQNERYPEDRNLPGERWNLILVEEVGEISRALLDKTPEGLEQELVQTAAVAVAWLEDIELQRRK